MISMSQLCEKAWQTWRNLRHQTSLLHDPHGEDGLKDKWDFIQTNLAKVIPVTPVFGVLKTLIAKDVLKEGGLGIDVLKHVLHAGTSSRPALPKRSSRSCAQRAQDAHHETF